jgi:hypothetical protein
MNVMQKLAHIRTFIKTIFQDTAMDIMPDVNLSTQIYFAPMIIFEGKEVG